MHTQDDSHCPFTMFHSFLQTLYDPLSIFPDGSSPDLGFRPVFLQASARRLED